MIDLILSAKIVDKFFCSVELKTKLVIENNINPKAGVCRGGLLIPVEMPDGSVENYAVTIDFNNDVIEIPQNDYDFLGYSLGLI